MTLHFHPTPNHPNARIRLSQKDRINLHDALKAEIAAAKPVKENPPELKWWADLG